MGIAYRKKNNKRYVQYTTRLREDILEKLKNIAYKEELSVNEVINQSLEYVLNDYENK